MNLTRKEGEISDLPPEVGAVEQTKPLFMEKGFANQTVIPGKAGIQRRRRTVRARPYECPN